jgi:hypothetical protein
MVVKVRNMEFTEEIKVEVHTSEEGFQGAWFEGVIPHVTSYGQHCIDDQHCKIQYEEFET